MILNLNLGEPKRLQAMHVENDYHSHMRPTSTRVCARRASQDARKLARCETRTHAEAREMAST